LRGTERRLQRLWCRGLQQPVLIELETLDLKLALLREELALHVERAVAEFGCNRAGLSQRAFTLDLMHFELMLLQPLLELELLQPACVLRGEVGLPRAQALLKTQIERVLLLFHVQPALIARVCRVRAAGKAEQSAR
jgi:hypothetical protein